MKYFILGLVAITIPIYSSVTWLVTKLILFPSSQENAVTKFYELHFGIFQNTKTMGLCLIGLCIIAMLLFSKSRKVNPKLNFVSIMLMLFSGCIGLYQGILFM